MNMWQAAAVALTVPALIGFLKFLFHKTKARWSRWRRQRAAAAEARRAARKRRQRDRVLRDRVAVAAASGKAIEIGRTGRRPVEVTFSDGGRSYYFCGDMQAYTVAMRSGRYPLTRTFHTAPPPLK